MAIDPAIPANGPGEIPDATRAEAMVIRQFEEANDRTSTPAERRLLRQLADAFDDRAARSGKSGWDWLGLAIDDAVAAGSRFVAPKRVREILNRWEREGLPAEYGGDLPARDAGEPVTTGESISHRSTEADSVREPGRPSAPVRRRDSASAVRDEEPGEPFVAPVFTISSCGMSNRQVWSAVVSDIEFSGAIGRADVSTWLRSAAILAVGDDGGLVLGVPHDLALRRASGRYLGAIRQSVERVIGLALPVTVVLFRDWAA